MPPADNGLYLRDFWYLAVPGRHLKRGEKIAYGTLDEYLTGEHDKMVKYVWRFTSPTQMVLEVHDLPIGENNTKVVEITFRK